MMRPRSSDFSLLQAESGASTSLVLRDVTVSYQRIPAVHHVNLDVAPGKLTALIGPNGAGKTTLLKAVAGLLPLETGQIRPGGGRANSGERKTRQRQWVAYVPQRESVDWDFPITVRGVVEMGRYPSTGPWGFFTRKDSRIVEESLHLMELEEFADRQIKKLSGGQQQRVFLARAWAQQSSVYLLDEPFTGLDANAKKSFRGILRKLRDKNKVVLASHHELSEIPEIFDDVVVMNGELIASGSVAEVFGSGAVERAFSVGVYSGHSPHEHA